MDQFPFVLTIFFMLLGPARLIPALGDVMRGADEAFERAVAWRAALIAAGLLAVVALMGSAMLGRFQISGEGLRIAGGLVILLSALVALFTHGGTSNGVVPGTRPLRHAVTPVVNPVIVTPAGVASVMIFRMLEPEYPGIGTAVALALGIVLVLDFLVMHFHSAIQRALWPMPVIRLLGAMLMFVQVCLGVETILGALQKLTTN